ncbi:YfiT family bacillithiol transferase [Flavobacterium polysaccharolyticum]|uniref:YfiT family bacillithiol transferase n=1 Tax=Flavobacterium polysaccharolyticum TaxID=3133148 RepID=A0ABU9NKM4_9FLAO
MNKKELERLQYPIGKFKAPNQYTKDYLKEKIEEIGLFVKKLETEVSQLNEDQLETPYRPEGWTIRQVIHHCADSHMNCFIRIKWALTENKPTIKYYEEGLWGEGFDNKTMPITPTLELLKGLHFRITYLLRNLSEEELNKNFIHPEHSKTFSIKEIIGIYAWHCNHHLAHITELKKRKKW